MDHNPYNRSDCRQQIGARLHNLRKSEGVTQRVYSEKFGISPQQYARIERGEALITTHVLLILRTVFKVDINYILDGDTNLNGMKALSDRLSEYPLKKRQAIIKLIIETLPHIDLFYESKSD